jgi:hypothetical protein
MQELVVPTQDLKEASKNLNQSTQHSPTLQNKEVELSHHGSEKKLLEI